MGGTGGGGGHLEAGEAKREGGSVLWWEAPGSGAGTEGRLLLPPVRGVMRGNRAWRRREAAWAAGRGVWRSLDKEMMKRERYIYQGGGDGWEGGKKDKLFHNNHRKHSPSDSPRGPRRPLCKLSPEAVPEPWGGVRGGGRAPIPNRARIPGLGMG